MRIRGLGQASWAPQSMFINLGRSKRGSPGGKPTFQLLGGPIEFVDRQVWGLHRLLWSVLSLTRRLHPGAPSIGGRQEDGPVWEVQGETSGLASLLQGGRWSGVFVAAA